MKHYLCIDVGGTSIKYGLLDEEGHIIQTQSVKAPLSLLEMYEVFANAYYQYQDFHLQGIALSMPGAVDSESGVIGGSSAYDYIHGPNIKKDLEEKFKIPVEIENDANCAALAEVWKGAASDVNDCCFIVSGTGIGGAIVKNKKIHKGVHLHGGEFGYMISKLDAHERPIKTWSDASTVNILKDIAKEKNIDFHLLDAKDIFDHYHNDPIYEKYINEYYWSMANGIYNLQYAYDPEKIVIGGGISMRDDLIDEINQRLDVIFKTFTHAHVRPIILTCQYHNDANLIGALFHDLTKSTSV